MIVRTRFSSLFLAALGASLLAVVPARAGIIFAVDSTTVAPGSTGNGLDVTLTNTGVSAITVGAFTFAVTTTDTDITFEANTNISTLLPYIFAGDTLGAPINQVYTIAGQTMDGTDFALNPAGDTVAAGATVGLGHLLFDVSNNATTGSFAVTLLPFSATSLSDSFNNGGGNIPIDTPTTPGQITISAVPEPASALLLISALGALVAVKRRRR